MAALQQGSEVRRVQRLGGSSLVITIPKQWARRMSIKPGDEVAVIDEGDALRITPLEIIARDGRVLKIKLNGVIERIGYGNIALCAYSLGYAGVSLEWNVKSIKVDYDYVVSELEKLPFTDYVEARPGRVIAAFKSDEGGSALNLKMLGYLINEVMESGRARKEDVEASIARVLRGYNACQAPGFLAMLYPLVDLLLELDPGLPSEAREKLVQAINEYVGGTAVGSIKRLVSSLELASQLERLGGEGRSREHALLQAIAHILKRMALGSICSILASKE